MKKGVSNDEALECNEVGNPGVICSAPAGMPFGLNARWRSPLTGFVNMHHRVKWDCKFQCKFEDIVYGADAVVNVVPNPKGLVKKVVKRQVKKKAKKTIKKLKKKPQSINLPSWKKIKIDIEHITDRHMVGKGLAQKRAFSPST